MAKLEIKGTGFPGATEILLDGLDIANALRGLTLDIGVDHRPSVTLELGIFEEDVQVILPESVTDVLVRLGWTPPA